MDISKWWRCAAAACLVDVVDIRAWMQLLYFHLKQFDTVTKHRHSGIALIHLLGSYKEFCHSDWHCDMFVTQSHSPDIAWASVNPKLSITTWWHTAHPTTKWIVHGIWVYSSTFWESFVLTNRYSPDLLNLPVSWKLYENPIRWLFSLTFAFCKRLFGGNYLKASIQQK